MVDTSNNVFISETGNNCVRKVTVSTGNISRFAGGGATAGCSFSGAGTTAILSTPYGIAIDSSNNLYLADSGNNCIRKITSAGAISNFAGGGANTACSFSGTATSVSLITPTGVAVSGSRVFIGDSGRNCVREVVSGNVSPTAGTGTASYSGDGGWAQAATFNVIAGLAVTPGGDLIIVDYNNQRVRRVITP